MLPLRTGTGQLVRAGAHGGGGRPPRLVHRGGCIFWTGATVAPQSRGGRHCAAALAVAVLPVVLGGLMSMSQACRRPGADP